LAESPRSGEADSEVDAREQPHQAGHAGKDELKSLPLTRLQERLQASPEGLTQSEAQRRLTQYGYNEIAEKKVSAWRKLLSYFWGPIPWMIEVAMGLSAVLGHWEDFVIIGFLLLMNAAVGFWEEYQAGNAVAALKATLALQARVKREGKWGTIPVRELVPGDVIRLRLGDVVPADAKLMPGGTIEVDQSALTGESLPVTRQSGEVTYSGSVVKRGEADALVYATGEHTFFGRTVQLVETVHLVSHVQRTILKIADYLIAIAIALVVLIVVVGLFRGENLIALLQFALVLTVASIPVAMPAVLSVTMAVGARSLAKMQAVVTRLAAIDELAGMDVLCADKTGTITQNKLTLGDPFVVDAETPEQVVLAAALASRAEDRDPIDLAVLGGVRDSQKLRSYQVSHYMPFDPVHKRTEATVLGPDGESFRVSKGAPQVILALASDQERVGARVDQAVNEFASRGFRSLGVARADGQSNWQFLGVLPLYDPPRPDSKATIQTARKMGVKVKMITGDQVAIAKEIARQMGLGTNIMDASVFAEARQRENVQLADTIEQADGFAQVFPEDKYRIVETLQQRGHIVGMTGDGVNDAPPLKKADVGIAVSGATDAARAAADIVLLASGLSVIIEAIKQSRQTFQRMYSYATYRITETIRLVLFLTLSIVIFQFYPVTPIMIVLLAVLNDGAILSISYDNTRHSNRPEVWNMPLVLSIATVLGLMGVVESFGLLFLAERVFHLAPVLIPSLIYLKLSVAGHLTVFVVRTRGPFWSIPPAPILLAAVSGTQLLATLITVYGFLMAPISWELAAAVWAYALFWFLVEDRLKLAAYRIFDPRERGLLTSRTQ